MRPVPLDGVGVMSPLAPLSPHFSISVYRVIRWLSPAYLRYALKIRSSSVSGLDVLLRHVQAFQAGDERFSIAFRHASAMDPQCVYYLFSNVLHRYARKSRVKLRDVPHVTFVYGRGVPLWAGKLVEWILPRIGAMPVFQGSNDAGGLRALRGAYSGGRFPVALAPEGQVTYHNYRVDDLQYGAARLALWNHQDSQTSDPRPSIAIIPLAPIYTYPYRPHKQLARVLHHIQRLLGKNSRIEVAKWHDGAAALVTLSEDVVCRLEDHYRRHYGIRADVRVHTGRCEETDLSCGDPVLVEHAHSLSVRFKQLGRSVMLLVERGYGIATDQNASLVSRIFTARHMGWTRRYRGDIQDISKLPIPDRSMADRTAAEAYLLSRHLELVDILAYFDLGYAFEIRSMDRLIETALNLYDVISRTCGNTIAGRLKIPSAVHIRVGEPIDVSHLAERADDRRHGVELVHRALESELLRLSHEF